MEEMNIDVGGPDFTVISQFYQVPEGHAVNFVRATITIEGEPALDPLTGTLYHTVKPGDRRYQRDSGRKFR
jgi:hypothetical protein